MGNLFLGRYRDPDVLLAQQTDHEQLIKAADSAHICPVRVEFSTIYIKHTKAQRLHKLFGSTEEPHCCINIKNLNKTVS